MRYGGLKVIGEQIFFDNIAVADIREDVLEGHKQDFIKKILKTDKRVEAETEYHHGYEKGYKMGKMDGYVDRVQSNIEGE